MPNPTPLRAIGRELGALLLAASCAGCDAPGQLLCDACACEIAPVPRLLQTPGRIDAYAGLDFTGVAARCVRRLKGEGETLLARPLAGALAAVLLPQLVDGAIAVPVPTSRTAFRRRGYRVPDLLVGRTGARPARMLVTARAPAADQRGLGIRERRENVRGTMRARRRGAGVEVVIVDDVITTGATIDEAARALGEAGFRVRCAVALAATPRLRGSHAAAQPIHRRHGAIDP